MDEDWVFVLFDVPHVLEGLSISSSEVVPVDRTDVVEAEPLEQLRGRYEALKALLRAPRELDQLLTGDRHGLEERFDRVLQPSHLRRRPAAREKARERTHVPRDRHLVVVEDDEQVRELEISRRC